MRTPPEEPLDLAAVARDDEVIERLRRSLSPDAAVVWGDDEDDSDDPSYAMLRTLQLDVGTGLPVGGPLPTVAGVTRRRRLGRGATVAIAAAGVLSLAGAAAASSSPGDPLYPVRSAIASAVHEAVQAVRPDRPAGSRPASPGDSTAPGAGVGTAARTAALVQQAQGSLAQAARLLAAGQYAAALAQLDRAGAVIDRLPAGPERSDLVARATQLRAALTAAQTAEPSRSGAHPGGSGASGNPARPAASTHPQHPTSGAGRAAPSAGHPDRSQPPSEQLRR